MNLTKKPIMLLDIGKIQVFTYQTEEEVAAFTPYKEVYWQDVFTKTVYGPFTSIYEALGHNAFMHITKTPPGEVGGGLAPVQPLSVSMSNIIDVDFKTRKRVL